MASKTIEEKLKAYETTRIETKDIGQAVDELVTMSSFARKSFERRWYDNNFFDDGYHFRYVSRSTNKVIDLSDRAGIYAPVRAIPKASRQIRGVTNLLVSSDPVPIVYPEKIESANFANPEEAQMALKIAQDVAKRQGKFLEFQFDEMELTEKLIHAVLMACKHGVSYIQIWPDDDENIKLQVFDGFDIYLIGSMTELEDCPYIIKAFPTTIANIKENPNFDEVQLAKIGPDNKLASSEIKQAYLSARFGRGFQSEKTATLILKESFIKEHLNQYSADRISRQENAKEVLQGRDGGDMVIRHTFSAGNIWLFDEYLKEDHYPIVDIRFEPGPIYQVPVIERFIPANKSIDMVSSRVERYTNTMVAGAWLKRQGEQFHITNQAGGQVIEYDTTAPVQAQIAPLPAFVFNYLSFLDQVIEEQGVSTSTLGRLPTGVRANAAIESLKESEYANLVVPQRMIKKSLVRIAKRILEIADEHFVTPKTVYYLEKGKPNYFEVAGSSAANRRSKVPLGEDVTLLKKDCRVDIEIESGIAFTQEGKKATAMQWLQQLLPYAQGNLISPDALKIVLQKYLEASRFGALSEFMEGMDQGVVNGNLSESQISAIKVAVLQVMDDLIKQGVLPSQDQRIQEGKIAAAEFAKDVKTSSQQSGQSKGPSESISFKDLPPEGQAQMAAQAGIQLHPQQIVAHQQQQQEQQMAVKQNVQKGGI